MSRITGSSRIDSLFGTDRADVIRGRGAGDFIAAGAGSDTLYGQSGNDVLYGGAGVDRLYGGAGSDLLEDWDGLNYLRGGLAHDELRGSGTLVGGHDDDYLYVAGGIAYGDAPDVPRAAGNDWLVTDLSWAPGESRTLVGGGGADSFTVTMAADGIATRTVIADFNRDEGDTLRIDHYSTSSGYLVSAQVFALLDRNGDRLLSSADGGSGFGFGDVHDEPGGLALQGVDGDVVVLAGLSSVAADFLIG